MKNPMEANRKKLNILGLNEKRCIFLDSLLGFEFSLVRYFCTQT